MIKNNKLQRMYNKYTEECEGTKEMFYEHIIRLLNRKMYIFVYGSKIFSSVPYEVLDIIYSFCNFEINYDKCVSPYYIQYDDNKYDDSSTGVFYDKILLSVNFDIKILDKTYVVEKIFSRLIKNSYWYV